MKFIKENISDIIKLYVNQIGIVIFTLALVYPLSTIEVKTFENLWDLLASIVAIIFYYVLLYNVLWEIGAKDRIRVDSGRYERTPAKGALLGICANIPNLIFSLPLFVFTVIYVTTGACAKVYAVFNLITRFHETLYMGTVLSICDGFGKQDFREPIQIVISALFLLIPFVSALITHFSYVLGYKEIRLFGMNPSKKKR